MLLSIVSGLRLPLSHDILINTSRHVVVHCNFMLIISKNVDFILITIYLLWFSFVGSYLHRCFEATLAPSLIKYHPYGFPTTCGLLLKRPLRAQSTSLIKPYFRCIVIASILLACPCQEWPPFLYGKLFIPEGMALEKGWLLHYGFQTSKLLILERQVWKCQRGNQKPEIEGQTIQWQKEKDQKDKQYVLYFFHIVVVGALLCPVGLLDRVFNIVHFWLIT